MREGGDHELTCRLLADLDALAVHGDVGLTYLSGGIRGDLHRNGRAALT
jgi:hypothetical protein